jgi:hypothetical protein
MLEKAILLGQEDQQLIEKFGNAKNFLSLDDDKLLNMLSDLGGKSAELVNNVRAGNVYKVVFKTDLNQEQFQMSSDFLLALKNTHKVTEISDNISKQFNEKHNKTEYVYICDIITSRAPSEIQIDEQDEETGEYVDLRRKSRIVGAIQSQSQIKVYADSKAKDVIEKEKINRTLKEIIEGLRID